MLIRHKGKILSSGSQIGIIALGGPREGEDYSYATELLQSWGYKTRVSVTMDADKGYLAGSDELRARELNSLFKDPEIDAIICFDDSFGAERILNMLDYRAIRQQPKLLIGFGAITALHTVIGQNSRLVTIHGPGIRSLLKGASRYTVDSLWRGLQSSMPIGAYPLPCGVRLTGIHQGAAFGRLVGGNLSTLAALCGTDFELNGENCILFLEEFGKSVQEIDSALNQLWLNGLFNRVSGIVWGEFGHTGKRELSHVIGELWQYYSDLAEKPAVSGLPVGHGRHNGFLPLGVNAKLVIDDSKVEFFISEPHCKLR